MCFCPPDESDDPGMFDGHSISDVSGRNGKSKKTPKGGTLKKADAAWSVQLLLYRDMLMLYICIILCSVQVNCYEACFMINTQNLVIILSFCALTFDLMVHALM